MNNNEPVTLGKIKKGGGSKPLVVVILFLFVGGVILFLPTILNYFGDYSIIDLIKNGEIVDFFTNHEAYVNGNKQEVNKQTEEQTQITYINNKTTLQGNNFTLSEFDLKNDSISFKITVTNTIDFDKENYYLELIKDSKTLSVIKLVGNIEDNNIQNFNFKNNLDSIVQVQGSIKKYNENDYPAFTLSSDESGLASFNCNIDNDSYEYLFSNNKLIKIRQRYSYIDNGNNNEYIDNFEEYSKLSSEINNSNNTSTITENNNGFIFTTDIDLTTYNKLINNNYYSYNTSSKKIKFEMEAKGYDCK